MKAALSATIVATAFAASTNPYGMTMGAPTMGNPTGGFGVGSSVGAGMGFGAMGGAMGMGAPAQARGFGLSGSVSASAPQSQGRGFVANPGSGSGSGSVSAQGRGGFVSGSAPSGSNYNYGALQTSGAFGGQGTQGAMASMHGQQQQRSAPMSSDPTVSGFSMSRALNMGMGMGMGGGMGMGMGGGMGGSGSNGNYDITSMFAQLGSQMQGVSGAQNYGGQSLNNGQWQGLQSGSGIQGPGIFGGGTASAMSQRLQQAQGTSQGFAGVTGYQSAMNTYGQNAGYQQAPSYTF